jgi:hypothetical protein
MSDEFIDGVIEGRSEIVDAISEDQGHLWREIYDEAGSDDEFLPVRIELTHSAVRPRMVEGAHEVYEFLGMRIRPFDFEPAPIERMLRRDVSEQVLQPGISHA